MPVQANSWEVLQSVNIESNLGLQQVDSHRSQQAVNIMQTNTTQLHSQQQLSLMGNNINLQQVQGNNSQQALNLLSANQLEGNKQTVVNGGELTLQQTAGNANTQAANLLTTQGKALAMQNVFVNRLTLQQDKGQENIQAGNAASVNTGQLIQNFSAQAVNVNINSATEAVVVQAANYVNYTKQMP